MPRTMLKATHLHHASILLGFSQTVLLIDPFKLSPQHLQLLPKTLVLAITHPHFDHLSVEDIQKVSQVSQITAVIYPTSIAEEIAKVPSLQNVRHIALNLGENAEINSVTITAFPAYNTNKINPQTGAPFHPKENNWAGFIFTFMENACQIHAPYVKGPTQLENASSIYVAGDTDFIPEMQQLAGTIDLAFLPVSGTYVMTPQEALQAYTVIAPKTAVPIHYGVIVGSPEDAKQFVEG